MHNNIQVQGIKKKEEKRPSGKKLEQIPQKSPLVFSVQSLLGARETCG